MPSVTRIIAFGTCRVSKNLGVIRSPLYGASIQQDVGVDALLFDLSFGCFQLEDDSTDFDNI
jgi:hypothetical protein